MSVIYIYAKIVNWLMYQFNIAIFYEWQFFIMSDFFKTFFKM